jgi:hypothetical protein
MVEANTAHGRSVKASPVHWRLNLRNLGKSAARNPIEIIA